MNLNQFNLLYPGGDDQRQLHGGLWSAGQEREQARGRDRHYGPRPLGWILHLRRSSQVPACPQTCEDDFTLTLLQALGEVALEVNNLHVL